MHLTEEWLCKGEKPKKKGKKKRKKKSGHTKKEGNRKAIEVSGHPFVYITNEVDEIGTSLPEG